MSATQTDNPRGRSAPERPSATEPVIDPIKAGESSASTEAVGPKQQSPTPIRWWAGVAVGGVVTCPLAWLLSFAATLPFFIGVFFFAVFGLIIGASVQRVAATEGHYALRTVLLGTTLLVLFGWGVSIFLEADRFPTDVAKYAIEEAHDIGNRTAAEFRADVTSHTRQFLREHYPPGGLWGYAKWSLLSSRILPGEVRGLRYPFRSGQAKFWWALRIALSIGLLSFGISSQTLPLADSARTDVAGGTASSL